MTKTKQTQLTHRDVKSECNKGNKERENISSMPSTCQETTTMSNKNFAEREKERLWTVRSDLQKLKKKQSCTKVDNKNKTHEKHRK